MDAWTPDTTGTKEESIFEHKGKHYLLVHDVPSDTWSYCEVVPVVCKTDGSPKFIKE